MLQIPFSIIAALKTLGENIRNARKRRRITMNLLAERAKISRVTLSKIEKGDPSVAIKYYASVLQMLGLLKNLEEVAAAKNDGVGVIIEEENLPQRVRLKRKK
ncbi:MAG: helix-turn-helix transcriptional regulator [Deltaproteobacteria bacterium]|nr:helix-turn-helix transcriptional regulator [Candidatus Tharpella aukensis]